MTIVAIHQSQYIPWPPYFRKIVLSDVFVLLDSVQFQKNGVQNRNRIRNKEKEFWLTIPVSGHMHDSIIQKKISMDYWRAKHWNSIKNSYSKSTFWEEYDKGLCELYNRSYSSLAEVNEQFLDFFLKKLSINKKIIRLSEMGTMGTKSELILNICKQLNADVYLSGEGGMEYLDYKSFVREGIAINYPNLTPPIYKQGHGNFIPGLSILDYCFNVNKQGVINYLGG